ncbi:unnamed protein product [Clonostachys solani]|uniref:Heterokaryon incompatibility domain-containing protein n=1 Tax=Clonostachys solani TaxID=160281 RepID=A0A9P0EFE4_9HYPO|nr:unnamed protein product [Clonostachys solani]
MASHIYERVQELYDGNEESVASSFKAQRLIYVPSNGENFEQPVGWIDIAECAKRAIDPATIYPQSSELFKFLLADTVDEVEGLILKATSIDKSHSLEAIGQRFTSINAALASLSKGRIKQVMNQVQNSSIFPITLNREENSYGNLQSASALNWVVADRPHLRDSFAGKVPLLAFSPKEIHSLSNLLKAFNLDSRRLSKLTTSNDSHIGPSGEDYPRLCDELKNIRIYQASKIIQVPMAKYRNSEYVGSPSDGEVSLSVEDNAIHMFFTREGLSSYTLPTEASRMIAKHRGIDDSIHFGLLQAILSEEVTLKLQSTFAREGFFVEVDAKAIQDDSSPNEVMQVTDGVYFGLSGDIFTMPSPSGFPKDETNAEECFKRFETEGRPGEGKRQRGVDRPDRRIPLINFTQMIQGAVLVDDELDPHQDLQYLGEAMVRSGFKIFNNCYGSSSFTFRSPKESFAITEFLVRSGHPDVGSWKQMKPRYHIEVMASSSDSDGISTWSLAKFERARRFHFQDRPNRAVEDIMVLFRISNIYTKPKFHLIVDPWQLVTSKQIAFEGDQMLGTAITVEAIRPLFNINKPRIGMTWHNGITDNNRPHQSEMKSQEIAQPRLLPSGAPRWSRANWRDVDSVDSKVPERNQTSNPGQNRLTELSEPNQIQTDQGKPQTQPGKHVSKVEGSSIFDQLPPRSLPQKNASAHGMHGMRPFQVNHPPANLPAMAELASPTMLSSTEYRYRKLPRDHLRLFMLFPGEKDDALQGAVYSVSFEDAGIYRTLSYVWGDTASTHTLTTPQGSIGITTALMTALKTIRLTIHSVTLWVDALCINQADEVEKGFQIRLLPEIFQGAVCTLAFLGAGEDGAAAIELLLQIRAKDVIKDRPKEEWPRDLPPIDASWQKQRVPPSDANVWADVRRLFSRAWFRRSWIIQEVVVAPTVKVICGNWMTEWHDLFAAIEIVDQEHQGLNDDLRPWSPFLRLGRHREWESRLKRLSLHRLLESYRDVDSSLKRDRFFALVGLANDGNREEFLPDYNENFETVALRFAGGFISQGLGMKLLYRAGLTDQSDRFPSWLPDWTAPRAGSLSDSLDRGAEFDACASSSASIKYTPGSDEIMVHGSNVDVIIHITTIFNEPSKRDQFFLEIDKIVNSIRQNSSNEDLEETVWKTAAAGAERASYNSNQPGNISLAESYRALRSSQRKSKSSVAEKAMAYVSLLDDKVLGWRFALTRGHRCAMIPPQAETGDKYSIAPNGGCADLGLAIQPMKPQDRTCGCFALPEDKFYLAAHMRFLDQLAQKSGGGFDYIAQGKCRLGEGLIWKTECLQWANCTVNNRHVPVWGESRETSILQQVSGNHNDTELRCLPGTVCNGSIKKEGVVVFGDEEQPKRLERIKALAAAKLDALLDM